MYIALLCLMVTALQANDIFFEKNSAYPVAIGVEVTEHLESIQSPYMKVDVYQTAHCGAMLVLDGAIQLTQWDNAAYHEMIAHVPLQAHPKPRRVLIIGGGDGGSLTEVIKYPELESITLCEIDKTVIEVSKKYFPEFGQSFSEPRVTVVIEDAAEYIKKYKNYFDVIIVDASDPEGPASVLYSLEFYQDLYTALTADGIVVAQGESPFFHKDLITQWHTRNMQLFAHTGYYYALVPTYPSGVIGFMYCAKTYPRGVIRNTSMPTNLHYYTPQVHQASFSLPAFLDLK